MAVTPDAHGADPESVDNPEAHVPLAARAGRAMQIGAASVSLALMVGVGVWGYRLMVRDATGIPVVRAMQGPLRERPEAPGGEVALNVGLAVNAVAAQGGAAPTEETMVLAPPGQGLTEEDLIASPMLENEDSMRPETGVPAEEAPTAASIGADEVGGVEDRPLSADEVLALADRIAAGAAPLSGLPPEEVASGPGAPAPTDLIAASVPGVSRAPRPPSRPRTAAAAPQITDAEHTSAIAVRAEAFPLGTTLVQLGAYPDEGAATAAWTRISSDFSDFIAGREPVIQAAESAGQTFYRLRAIGFEDLADARRFCSALVAEEADCIPVVVR